MSLGIVQLADFPALISAGGIEIAEGNKTKLVSCVIRFQCVFQEEFAGAVRAERLPRSIFSNRNSCWHAINSAGGRLDKISYACFHHFVEQAQSALYVVPKITAGLLHGFAHAGKSREIHHGVNPAERWEEFRRVSDIAYDEIEIFGQEAVASREVVVNANLVPAAHQCASGMTADISRAAG